MHPEKKKRRNKGTLVIVAIFALAWAVFLVSSPGCGSNDARIEQHGDGTAEVKQQQGAVVIDDVQRLIDAQMTGVSQRVEEVCGDLSTIKASIEANNNQIAGVAQRAESVAGDLAAFKASIEARVGTLEKTDNSITGRDKTQADVQQGGIANWSWTEIGTTAGASMTLIGVGIWLYSWRKQNERTESARSDEDRRETERKWLDTNGMLAMANKTLLPLEYLPKPWPEPCKRGWWPGSKCKNEHK